MKPGLPGLLVLVAILAAAGVVAALVGLPDKESLRQQVSDAGALAPAAFIGIYALLTLLPLPKNVFSGLAGILFGLVWGVVVVMVAALLGAAAAFGLSRLLGRDAVERLIGNRVARVDDLLSRRGILSVVVVRMVPVLPFTAINYAAGLTAVRTRDYAIGTTLGILPGTVSFVALGAYGTHPGSWPFVVSVAALLLLTVGGLIVARRSRAKR
ncbi:TVP38/TMEM64 family protein [Nocardioides salsibiostraticola]